MNGRQRMDRAHLAGQHVTNPVPDLCFGCYADQEAEKDRPSVEESAAMEAAELTDEHEAGEHFDAMVVDCPVCQADMSALGFRVALR